MAESRIRICRTHLTRPTWNDAECVTPDCDIVEMVWSSDGTALLAIDQCAAHRECDTCGLGRGMGTLGVDWCLSCVKKKWDHAGRGCLPCDGRGYTYQAQTAEYGGVMGYLNMPPILEVAPKARVAVVPL